MPDEPLYSSKTSGKNLWQEYRVYPDRIELHTRPWGTIEVPLENVKSVAVRPPMVVCDLFRSVRYGVVDLLRTPKLDLADFHDHVMIEQETGLWKQFRLTPDAPDAFVAAVERARLANHPTEEPRT